MLAMLHIFKCHLTRAFFLALRFILWFDLCVIYDVISIRKKKKGVVTKFVAACA